MSEAVARILREHPEALVREIAAILPPIWCDDGLWCAIPVERFDGQFRVLVMPRRALRASLYQIVSTEMPGIVGARLN